MKLHLVITYCLALQHLLFINLLHIFSHFSGLTLVPEWDAKTEIDLQTVNVEDVKTGSSAETAGIRKGDELMLVNDTSVMELGWVEVEKLMSGS